MCMGVNMADEIDDNSKFAWFLAGAVIGAAAALLYAPKSGKDTRKYITSSTKEGREAMEASGKELMDRGKELYDRGKKIAEDAADLFERGRKLVQG
jgi:gas vesicle protein